MSDLSHPVNKLVGHTPDTCPFCKRFAKQEYDEETFDYFGHKIVTYENIKMSMPGHRLFVPELHVARMSDDPVLVGATVSAAAEWAWSRPELQFNIIVSQGGYATQSVQHVHVHLTPRGLDDTLPTGWPWRGLMREHGVALTPVSGVASRS